MTTPSILAQTLKKGCGKTISSEEGTCNYCGKFIKCSECKSQAKAYLQAFQLEVEWLNDLNMGISNLSGVKQRNERLQNLKSAILILQEVVR